METTLELLAGLGLLCGVALLLILSISVLRVRRLVIQAPARTVVARGSVPEGEIALLDAERPRLAALGFAYRYTVRSRRFVRLPGKDIAWSDVYERPDATYAWVERSDAPDAGGPATVSFATGFVDGTFSLTMNRYAHHVVGMPPNWQLHDDYLRDGDQAFAAHVRRVAEAGKAVERDGIALLERFLVLPTRMIESLREARWIERPGRSDRHRFTWAGAFRLVLRYLAGTIRAGRSAPAAANPDASGTAEAQSHALDRQYEQVKGLRWSRQDRRWLTALSIAGFAIVGTWLWGWPFTLVLFVVIGVHEAGHSLAMRLVGYRDLNVFFLPGLGGIATGRKADATPLQKVFVYLAGPMPGILAAVALLIGLGELDVESAEWVVPLVIVTLFVNYLNLLPVTPLDGGRVVEILLFSRIPAARLAFVTVCALALVATGLATGDLVFAVFGGLLLLGLPHQWRVFRVERVLPPRPGALDEARAKEVVFAACTRGEFARWSLDDRSAVAQALVDELQSRRPRWAETAAGMAIYVACLVAPAYLILANSEIGQELRVIADLTSQPAPAPAPEPGAAESRPSEPPRDWEAEIVRSQGLPPRERLALFLDAMDHDHREAPGSRPLVDRAWDIARELPAQDPLHGRALLARASAAESETDRRALLREAVDRLSGTTGKDRLVLADALEQSYWVDFDAPDSLRQLETAFAIREAELPPADPKIHHTASEIARRHYAEGRREAAGASLERSLQALASARWDERQFIENEYAGFLIAAGRAPEAEARLAAFLATMPAASPYRSGMEPTRQRLLWSQLVQRSPEATARARATLTGIQEDMRRTGGEKRIRRNLPHQLTVLAVARASEDANAATAATKALREGFARARPGGELLCLTLAPTDRARFSWEGPRLEMRARLLAELGLCPAKPAPAEGRRPS